MNNMIKTFNAQNTFAKSKAQAQALCSIVRCAGSF